LNFLDDRNESRRYAAALVFRELARTAPFSINDRIENILDYLWTALRDPKVNIREVAASALSGCLKIASGRDTATRNECYAMVFEQAQRGFRINTGDAIHGSLLGYKELFTNGNMVGRLGSYAAVLAEPYLTSHSTVHARAIQ
jgi:FKBP12-rapamycin complex-associated protein